VHTKVAVTRTAQDGQQNDLISAAGFNVNIIVQPCVRSLLFTTGGERSKMSK
jgi:hypothetical protein